MGLNDVPCEEAVDAPWEEVEALERGVVSWTVEPALPLVPVVDSVVVTTASIMEAVSGFEEEGTTESLEIEVFVICVVAGSELIAVIRTGSEREEAPQAGYGHQLKDEVVCVGSMLAC